MRATRIPIALFTALLALNSCDGSPIQEPPLQEPPLQEPPPPPVLVLEAVTPLSTTGIVGVELAVAPVILVKQGDGLPLEGIQVSFVVSGSGFVGSATVMTDAGGLATPGTWRLGPGAGRQRLTARAVGRSLVFTADAQPGPITSLTVVGGNGQWAAVGTPLPVPLRVQASDVYGNGVTAAEVTFAVIDGGGSLAPGASITGADGIAESRWTLGTTAGGQHVRAQTGDASAQFTADACQPGHNFELAYVFEDNIFVFDGATCGMRQLTSDGLSNEPAWSPDGERIAFVRHDPVLNGIYVMNSDGSGMTRVTGAGHGSPTWSPQGDALAFTHCPSECGLYVQELGEGSVPRQIAEWGGDPAWSPDGSRIAFLRSHGELIPGDDTPFYSLRLINADGSGFTEIVPVTANMEGATWSPDGTRIAFSMNADIYVVHADGSGLTRLTTFPGAQAPAWSPDGTRIAYQQWSPDAGARIMAIPVEGGEPVTLVPAGTSPSWRP